MIWFLLIILFKLIEKAVCSVGDKSQYYVQCLDGCIKNTCQIDPQTILSLLRWSCNDDCSYVCTWKTVDYFVSHGLQVPQFHGKWPFARFLGLQEPASVFFSFLNFYAHWNMLWKFKRKIKSTYPMVRVWTYFSIISLTGWFWSIVFHARDKPFTEKMDYSCAVAIVLTLFYCLLTRITYGNKRLSVVILCAYLSTLYVHLTHLWSGKINYGYNMKFNIVVGFLTFVTTMVWWHRNRNKLPHVHLIGWFNISIVVATLLEVTEFPPILWIFDSHSLWHAITAPLTILLYRFMIFDCDYLNFRNNKLIFYSDHLE